MVKTAKPSGPHRWTKTSRTWLQGTIKMVKTSRNHGFYHTKRGKQCPKKTTKTIQRCFLEDVDISKLENLKLETSLLPVLGCLRRCEIFIKNSKGSGTGIPNGENKTTLCLKISKHQTPLSESQAQKYHRFYIHFLSPTHLFGSSGPHEGHTTSNNISNQPR